MELCMAFGVPPLIVVLIPCRDSLFMERGRLRDHRTKPSFNPL